MQSKSRRQIKTEFICIGAMFVLELVIILAAVITACNYLEKNADCTGSVDAVVTNVETRRVKTINTRDHGGRFKYVTETTVTISVETDGIFNEKTITSDAAYYEKGRKLKIYYDPDDPKDYYIEDQQDINKATLIVLVVIAALWMFVCTAVARVVAKHYKKYRNGEYIFVK